jgi:hypothetical protein
MNTGAIAVHPNQPGPIGQAAMSDAACQMVVARRSAQREPFHLLLNLPRVGKDGDTAHLGVINCI